MRNNVSAFVAVLCIAVVGIVTPARGQGTQENPKDLLDMTLLGCQTAASLVSTSSGRVTVHEWYWRANGQVLETVADYTVASKGDKFKVLAEVGFANNELTPTVSDPGLKPIPSRTVTRRELAYDGERVVSYKPAQHRALVASTDSNAGRDLRALKLQVLHPGNGVPTLSALSPLPNYTRNGPCAVGWELVDGDECVVVEYTDVGTGAGGAEVRYRNRFWIDPEKGFTLPKSEAWVQGGAFGQQEILLAQSQCQVRQYDVDLWGVSVAQSEQYALDSLGKWYLQRRTIITFASDYRLNTPVSDDMLAIALPSGTKVYNELLDEQSTAP
jgi:hypothetical protein